MHPLFIFLSLFQIRQMEMKKNVRIKSLFIDYSLRLHLLLIDFSRCQLLSCTTEKLGKKKNRKNRLRAFPNKWNELTKENREAIRRELRKNVFFSQFDFNQSLFSCRNSTECSTMLYTLL